MASDRPTPAQLKAARAMLGWSMVDLAKAARVSVLAVKRAEAEGPEALPGEAFAALCGALQDRGVRFCDDGIHFRAP